MGPSSCEPACPRVPLGLASPSRTGNTPSREAVASPSNLKMSARRPVSMSARLGAPGAHKSPDLNASQKQKTEHAKPAENTNDAAAAVSAMSVRRRTMAVAPPLSLEPPAIVRYPRRLCSTSLIDAPSQTSRSNRTTTLRTSGAMPEFGPTTPSHRRTFSRADVQAKEKAIYEGVPGHKQESKRVAVKSVAEPDVVRSAQASQPARSANTPRPPAPPSLAVRRHVSTEQLRSAKTLRSPSRLPERRPSRLARCLPCTGRRRRSRGGGRR